MLNATDPASASTVTQTPTEPGQTGASPTVSRTDTTSIQSGLASALENNASKKSEKTSSAKRFSPEGIEKIIRAIAKLVEAFAALTQAYKKSALDRNSSAPSEQPQAPADVPESETQAPETPAEVPDTSTDTTPVDTSEAPSTAETSPEAAPETPSAELSAPSPAASSAPSPAASSAPSPAASSAPSPAASSALVDRGQPLERTAGFLWKPESDKDGKLAILLPEHLTGKVKAVCILSPDGSRTLQSGKYAGNGNGGREHFRFSKPGGEFPDGSIVLIKLADGSRHYMKIRETSARVQK